MTIHLHPTNPNFEGSYKTPSDDFTSSEWSDIVYFFKLLLNHQNKIEIQNNQTFLEKKEDE